MRVIRTMQTTLLPRAECLGDGPPDHPTNCETVWSPGSGTLAAVKVHIQIHPTHQVGVVHETRSIYEAQQ